MSLLFVDTLKKVTTTPLLEYLKQRKQEKQRLRDEKREERRRRDLERRRTKEDPIISKVNIHLILYLDYCYFLCYILLPFKLVVIYNTYC